MPNADNESWLRVKERLRAEVGDDIYSSWFARMDLEAIEDGTVRLSVPTRFLKSWIQSHYAERVLACWQAENDKISRVELIVRSAVLRSTVANKPKELEPAAGRRPLPEQHGQRQRPGDADRRWHRCTRRSAARRSMRASPSRASWSAAPIRWRTPPPSRWPPPSARIR